ncbi:MAG: hypothetical protein OEU92_13830 [Alphaproteobacteria bacterium]|nr:hypothetical protein [Alphaproteobacteria bacterium]
MRNACLITVALGFTAVSSAPATATADEVIEQIEAGKAYYAEGDLARALTEFEFALNALRTRFSNAFMATLPGPPALWSAEKPMLETGAALFGAGVMVTRRYLEEKGEGQITAELMVDSPMVQAFSAVFSNPIMIANDPGLERVRLGKMTALLNWDEDRRTGDLSLPLGGRVLAKLIGRDLDDKTILVQMMKAWDLDAVKDVAGF